MKYLSVKTFDSSGDLLLEVSGGIGGDSWAVYKRRPYGRSIHRLTSPLCPVRQQPEIAEIDLAVYCAMRLGDNVPTHELVNRYRDEVSRLRSILRMHGISEEQS